MRVHVQPGGEYQRTREGVEFVEFLEGEGWHIIPIKAADQLVRPPPPPRARLPLSLCLSLAHTHTPRALTMSSSLHFVRYS